MIFKLLFVDVNLGLQFEYFKRIFSSGRNHLQRFQFLKQSWNIGTAYIWGMFVNHLKYNISHVLCMCRESPLSMIHFTRFTAILYRVIQCSDRALSKVLMRPIQNRYSQHCIVCNQTMSIVQHKPSIVLA